MKPDMFRQPVSILVGLGFPAEVRSVMDAYRHLVEWPVSMRDAAHTVALKACSAALRGEIEAETARGLFAAFAEKHDLLAPDTNSIAASRLRRRSGSARAVRRSDGARHVAAGGQQRDEYGANGPASGYAASAADRLS